MTLSFEPDVVMIEERSSVLGNLIRIKKLVIFSTGYDDSQKL